MNRETPYVVVNGATFGLQAGGSFSGQIMEIAEEARLGKFNVVINGRETYPEDAPEIVTSSMVVELKQYDQVA